METITCNPNPNVTPPCECLPIVGPQPGLTCDDVAQCPVVQGILEDLTEVQDGLQNTDQAVADLDSRLDDAEADIQALELAMTGVQADIIGLQGDVSTLQTDVGTLQGDVATAQADATQALLDAAQAQSDAQAAQATADIGARWREQQEMLLEGVGLVHRLLWSFTGNPTVLTLTANSYTYQTFVCDLPFAPTNLYLYIQTPQAGATAQFALWDDSGVFSACPAPGQVIWPSAVFSAAASGLVVIPLTGLPALTPGARYYCGLICSSNAVEFRSYANAQMSILSNVLNTRVWRASNAGQSPGGTPPTNPTITAVNSSNSLLYLVS